MFEFSLGNRSYGGVLSMEFIDYNGKVGKRTSHHCMSHFYNNPFGWVKEMGPIKGIRHDLRLMDGNEYDAWKNFIEWIFDKELSPLCKYVKHLTLEYDSLGRPVSFLLDDISLLSKSQYVAVCMSIRLGYESAGSMLVWQHMVDAGSTKELAWIVASSLKMNKEGTLFSLTNYIMSFHLRGWHTAFNPTTTSEEHLINKVTIKCNVAITDDKQYNVHTHFVSQPYRDNIPLLFYNGDAKYTGILTKYRNKFGVPKDYVKDKPIYFKSIINNFNKSRKDKAA